MTGAGASLALWAPAGNPGVTEKQGQRNRGHRSHPWTVMGSSLKHFLLCCP